MTERLGLVEYFDALIDEVDLKAEILLQICSQSSHKEFYETVVKNKRRLFIEQIETVKRLNLSITDDCPEGKRRKIMPENDDKLHFQQDCFILDKFDMKIRHYMDSNTHETANHFDSTINETFGYLVIVQDGPICERHFELFRELLSYGNDIIANQADHDLRKAKFSQPLKQSFPSTSNIFDCDFLDAMEACSASFKVFKEQGEKFIIRASQSQLYAVDELNFNSCDGAKPIKSEALHLLFGSHQVNVKIDENSLEAREFSADCALEVFEFYDAHLCKSLSIHLNNSNPVQLSQFGRLTHLDSISFNNHSQSLNASNIGSHSYLRVLKLKHIESDSLFTKTSIEANAFEGVANLQVLDLSNNGISSIHASAFSKLTQLETLLLDTNNIKHVDANLFENLVRLTHLDLKCNVIRKIHPKTFASLSKLKRLYLNGSAIRSIDERLFKRLVNLEELTVSSDYLPTIPSTAFVDLVMLKYFKLGGEQIGSLDPAWLANKPHLDVLKLSDVKIIDWNVFKSLANLTQLDLYNCDISQLKQDDFTNLSRLRILNLAVNQIEQLKNDTFKQLSNLEELHLGMNRIQKVDQYAFDGLNSLKRLILSTNEIDSLDENTFKSLPKLELLNLSYNRIGLNKLCSESGHFFLYSNSLRELNLSQNVMEHVREGTFRGLVCLENLDLSSNNISHLEPNAFDGLCCLKVLSLQYNQIESLQRSAFKGLDNLLSLNLINNRLTEIKSNTFCGLCSLQEFNLKYNSISELDCGAFDQMTNLKVLKLSHNQLVSLIDQQFAGLCALETLNLSHNKIEWVQKNAFTGLGCKLTSLKLKANRLSKIPDIDELKNVCLLNLANNCIDQLDAQVLERLQTLTRLDLSYNNIDKIEPEKLKLSICLKEFKLNRNPVTSRLSRSSFVNLKNFARVNIQINS